MASWRSMVEVLASTASGYTRSRHTCPVCPYKAGVIDYKRSLSIDHERGWYRCYRCEFRGRLAGYEDGLYEDVEIDPEEWVPYYKFEDPSDYNPVAEDASISLEPARRYLKSRGVTKRTAREAKIGYALDGKHAGRIITPFLDHDGCWMGWQGRTIRYKSFHTERDRAALFWNETAVLEDTNEPLMVVEGVYDALPYWPNAVACLGKPEGMQVALLAQAKRPLAIVLDADAHNFSASLANELERSGRRAVSVQLAPGEDPGNVNHSDLRDLIRSAFQ